MSIQLASQILRGTWAIDPSYAMNQLPILDSIMKGQTRFEPLNDDEKAALEPVNFAVARHYLNGKSVAVAVIGSGNSGKDQKFIQLIKVNGVLMKDDQECGPSGMMTIANKIKRANSDSSISAIVLSIDSPGGMVEGTQTLADAVKNAIKPVVAVIEDGMACSAAYWVASAAAEIYATQKTCVFGSIGVYTTMADFKAYYESKGLKIHEIYADQSSEKNRMFLDALSEKPDALKANLLNPLASEFISAIKANRSGKLNLSEADPFKGDTYMAERAIKIGLIDGIKSIEEAILRADELANSSASNSGNSATQTTPILSSDMKIKINSSLTALVAVLGISFAQGETEQEVELTSENLQAINAKLASQEQDITAKDAEITRLGSLGGQTQQDPPAGSKEGASGEKKDSQFFTEADQKLANLKAEMGLK
ncbi:MAG: S49 family peptidase [Bacteroidia bacterium]|nr:S49 family peptidase [Bacteroidia bacterium]